MKYGRACVKFFTNSVSFYYKGLCGILGLCSGRRVYPESRYFCVLISNHFPNCISDERSVAQEVLHGALLKKKMVSKIITMLARLEMSTLSSGTNSVF